MKSRPFVLAACIFSCVLAGFLNQVKADNESFENAKIGKVLSVSETKINGFREQMVEIEVYDDKNETVFLTNNVPDNQAYAIEAKAGREYLINYDEASGQIYISDYYREKTIISLVILFSILVIIFGAF